MKTHRLGGWLFIVGGLFLIFTGVVRTQWAVMAMGAWFAIMVVWMFLCPSID